MRFGRKLGLGLLLTALAALAVAVAVASADPGADTNRGAPDPQTTNVPYLSWLGEQVRVEKCLRFSHTVSDAQVSDIRAKLSISFPGEFVVEDWTGVNEVNAGPKWTNGSAGPSGSTISPLEINRYGICWSAHLTSAKPGMAVVKLAVSMEALLSIKASLDDNQAGSESLVLGLDNVALFHDVLLKHQFLVIFMKAKAPSLYEVKGTDYYGGWGVADPLGDGIFTPWYEQGIDTFPGFGCHDRSITEMGADHARGQCHFNNGIYGLVKVDVKGEFPTGNDYAGMFAGNLVTLPDQWAELANKLAFDDSGANGGIPGSSPMRWDIHDNNNTGDGLFTFHPFFGLAPATGGLPDHSENSICLGGTNLTTDAVDNCWGGLYRGLFAEPYADGFATDDAAADFYGEFDWATNLGPFSHLYGGAFKAIGPFDPVRPWQTYLPDGILGPEDAPMPALRVDVKLSATSVGALDAVDKDDIYVKDATQSDGYPHNLYAPFYKSYIPASTPGSGRSGIAGSYANNFPGFLEDGVYDFWSIKGWVWRDGDNGCRAPFTEQRPEHFASDAEFDSRHSRLGGKYPLPTGWSHLSVYTDEHGQAFVKFLPYRGSFIEPDDQGNCDYSGHGVRTLGEADITATSIYPDQPVGWEQSIKVSTPLHKVVKHKAAKVLQCVPKSSTQAYCVETILDFNGDPVSGVKVKFTTSQDAGTLGPGKFDTFGDPLNLVPSDKSEPRNPTGANFDTTDQYNDVVDPQGDYVIVKTDGNGQAGVVVTNSTTGLCINVFAENLLTPYVKDNPGVQRHVKIDTTSPANKCGDDGVDDGSTATPPVTPPPAGGSTDTGATTTGGGGSATQSTVVSLGGPVIQAQPVLSATKSAVVAQATAKLFSVKVMQTKLGRYLVVNVKGTAKTAKIRIAVLGKNGKVLKTIVRTVPTNKAFKIANFKLAKSAVAVKASVTA